MLAPNFFLAENKGIEPSPDLNPECFSKAPQQANICLFSNFIFFILRTTNCSAR